MLKGRVPLILAAVFAVLAAVVFFLTDKANRDSISARWQPVSVMSVKRDMKSGDTLTSSNLAVIKLPKVNVTGSVITVDAVNQGLPVRGQKLSMDIMAGDPLLYSHIHTKTGDQHLADAVQKKGRAVSIRVSPESSVHHWVEPGDHVDIIGVFRDPQLKEMVSVTMLQNVVILATGRIGGQTNMRLLSETERAYNTVTVHVLPEAAEMLVLSQDLGTLYLSLRNPEDNDIRDFEDTRTSLKTLLTGERSKAISRTQSKIFRVEVIRGSHRVEMETVP
ncbi:MAG: Flp pilus assembly protein CpaB [Deltaproteobacteria bacterium RIFOXYA12_FULL_58_15]|nr:MAG: Flp pilus assembly protein CpaB [Deltaproteobacteria bacterium RIFOXYA12_FULL_58_15]OGR12845.1 MAG: Flp pilus assembly protein CpaB [Deltaproteobacteria bacterium RIFOXYB12_FULL_58_9]